VADAFLGEKLYPNEGVIAQEMASSSRRPYVSNIKLAMRGAMRIRKRTDV